MTNPIDSKPLNFNAIGSIPIDSNPIDSNPIDSNPIDSNPIDSSPIDSSPIILEDYGVQGQLLDIVRALYMKCGSAIRTKHRMTDWFNITTGVRQGCVLSALLLIYTYKNKPSVCLLLRISKTVSPISMTLGGFVFRTPVRFTTF
jgi:hypothetical protein